MQDEARTEKLPPALQVSAEQMAVYRATALRRRAREQQELAQRRERAWEVARRAAALLDAAALNLHDFYAGLEHLFHQIASSVDGYVPTGPEWHRDLLSQMSVELAGLCPPVLARESVQALGQYLSFRHVVRTVYAFQFDPERLEQLTSRLPDAFAQVSRDLQAFAAFLETAASE